MPVSTQSEFSETIQEEEPLRFLISGEDKGLRAFLQKRSGVEMISAEARLPDTPYIHAFLPHSEDLAFPGKWFLDFPKDDPILCQKIIIINSSTPPQGSVMSFFNEIWTDQVFLGPKRAQYLGQYIIKAINEKEMVGSSHYYRSEISRGLREGKSEQALSLLNNFSFSFDSRITDRISTETYMRLNMTPLLILHLKDVLRREPSMIWAAWSLAQTFLKENQPEYAMDLMEKIARSNFHNQDRIKKMASLYLEQNRFESVKEICEKAVQILDPSQHSFFKDIAEKSENSYRKLGKSLQIFLENESKDQYSFAPETKKSGETEEEQKEKFAMSEDDPDFDPSPALEESHGKSDEEIEGGEKTKNDASPADEDEDVEIEL